MDEIVLGVDLPRLRYESATDAELIRFVSSADQRNICVGYFLDTWCAGGGSDQRGVSRRGSPEGGVAPAPGT